MENLLQNLIIVGERVLVKPKELSKQTKLGLSLPSGVKEKEKVQSGYFVRLGSGYRIPSEDVNEVWKKENARRFVPLQVEEGDLAIFLMAAAHEVMYQNQKYFMVPQSAIRMLERHEPKTKKNETT